ncbi:MAG TPA: hypothetical protein VMZ03_08220 [Chitinophagaceae bacterium]|nr:hypothetical protein [Chitinophagaceae bacterium]
MTSHTHKTVYRLFLGALMLSFVIACNSKKDKKVDTATADTVKVDSTPPPPPMKDTMGMDKDTADTRPVKPGE